MGKPPPGRLLDCSARILVKVSQSLGSSACALGASQLAGGGGPGILRSLVGAESLVVLLPGRGLGGGVSGMLRMLLKEGWTVDVLGVCGSRRGCSSIACVCRRWLISSLTEEGAGLGVAGHSPYLGGVVVDAARAAGALEEGFVCNVLWRRFFGMNPEFLKRYSASTSPSAPDRNKVNLGGGGGVC
jgi:hypothetical protein